MNAIFFFAVLWLMNFVIYEFLSVSYWGILYGIIIAPRRKL